MARQQVEFEFPDPDKPVEGVDVDVSLAEKDEPLEIEGAVGREDMKKSKTPEVEIEVKDDTPPKDRNRKKSDPPEEVTDDELSEYSDKVKKRIQHFSKGYHDERRAKEQALREREELERYARQLVQENQTLKVTTDRSHNTLIEQAKQQVQLEVSAAQKKFKDAYEAGDADALVAAQEALTTAKIRADRVAGLKPKPLQDKENPVQQTQPAPQPAPQQVARDAKAESWRAENTWFGSDDEMTAYALGYHSKLVKEGVDPRSDEYYEKVNSRMRKMFPESFDDFEEEQEAPKPKKANTNVVAPATRSTGPRKVTLTATQVSIAKRLGVPLEQYAKQVAELQRK
jgi:hypothetical protein